MVMKVKFILNFSIVHNYTETLRALDWHLTEDEADRFLNINSEELTPRLLNDWNLGYWHRCPLGQPKTDVSQLHSAVSGDDRGLSSF